MRYSEPTAVAKLMLNKLADKPTIETTKMCYSVFSFLVSVHGDTFVLNGIFHKVMVLSSQIMYKNIKNAAVKDKIVEFAISLQNHFKK